MVKGVEGKTYEEQLKSPGLFRPEKESLIAYSFLMMGDGGVGADLFLLVISNRTQGNSMELCQRLRLDERGSSPRGWSGTGTCSPKEW